MAKRTKAPDRKPGGLRQVVVRLSAGELEAVDGVVPVGQSRNEWIRELFRSAVDAHRAMDGALAAVDRCGEQPFVPVVSRGQLAALEAEQARVRGSAVRAPVVGWLESTANGVDESLRGISGDPVEHVLAGRRGVEPEFVVIDEASLAGGLLDADDLGAPPSVAAFRPVG